MVIAITILVILIVFLIIIKYKKRRPQVRKSTGTNYPPSSQQSATTFEPALNHERNSTKIKNKVEDSIIDVTGQSEQIDISPSEENEGQKPYFYDQNEYRLAFKYKNALNLSRQEISWLNKFYNSTNVFLDIEGCCLATIKLYLNTLRELNRQLRKRKSNIAMEVEFFENEIMKLYYNANISNLNEYEIAYHRQRIESEIFETIFKKAENTVREFWRHKRKISSEFPYTHEQITLEFQNRIGNSVAEIFLKLASTIQEPDEKTENELNSQNVNRWKGRFDQLEKSFSKTNAQEFVNGIYALEKSNKENPSIENIFLQASKFVSKFDKLESLKFYIHYLYYDLKSSRFDNKHLPKMIQKNLFDTNDQLHNFEKVVAELLKTKDLDTALKEVVKVYDKKRRRINLNTTVIQQVQEYDKETVDLLNEYLKDEFEDEDTSIRTEEVNIDEIKLEIESKGEKNLSSFVNGISLNEIQVNIIEYFAEKSYALHVDDVSNYCKSKGVFINQLIDSINESCYEVLDDLLIEDNDKNYILNENYYKKLLA